MRYDLIVTERAEELLDNLVGYLLYRIKNPQAATHLFDSVEKTNAASTITNIGATVKAGNPLWSHRTLFKSIKRTVAIR